MLNALSGDVLLLDSGNALFRAPGVPADADAKKRGDFILARMGELGLKAMAAGHRDLNAGGDWLVLQAKARGVKVLSANLEASGKRLFAGSTTVKAGGLTVAVIGLTAPGAVPGEPGLVATPGLEAVKRELATLGPRDVTVVLAAVSWNDTAQLANELKGQVDFVIDSSEPHGAIPPQRYDTGVFVLSGGAKGQAMGKLSLDVSGAGAWVDVNAVARDQAGVPFLEKQVKTLEDRASLAKDAAAKAELAKTLGELKQRLADQKKKAEVALGPASRKLKLDWVMLDGSVKDDGAMKKQVLEIEPSYAGPR